jgi:hypothetical protein
VTSSEVNVSILDILNSNSKSNAAFKTYVRELFTIAVVLVTAGISFLIVKKVKK